MAGMLSPNRGFNQTLARTIISPQKETPRLADLSVTTATVHPRDWHLHTARDTHTARTTKVESTSIRAESSRLLDNKDLAIRATESRVNLALRQRVNETHEAIYTLEASLAETDAEIAELDQAKAVLQSSLAENQQKITVPRACLARRSQRPANERVLDEAEIELTAELRQFEETIAHIQEQVKTTEIKLRTLRAAKFKIERNLADKREALEADEHCLNLREKSASP